MILVLIEKNQIEEIKNSDIIRISYNWEYIMGAMVLNKKINKYYSDITLPDILSGIIIRSPIEGGTIRSISHPNLPEGYFIVTAKDIPGKNLIQTRNIETAVLAYERVSYKGEPIGILVGPDQVKLYEILKELDIKYTEAQESEEVLATKNNIIASRESFFGESELLYTNSPIQLNQSYVSKLQFTRSKETIGAICNYTKKHFTVYVPTQWPHHLRTGLSQMMECNKNDITIVKTITENNATNTLWRTSIAACQAAVASYVTGKPVKISISRREQDKYVDSPIIVNTDFQTALDEDGTIIAMNADVKVDCGAFCPFAQEILDRMVIALSSMYRYKNYSITAYAVESHQPPRSADLHLTDFLAFFSLENLIQDISKKLNIFPNEIRLINTKVDSKDKKNYPFLLDYNPLKLVIDKVVKESDFLRKHVAYNMVAESSDTSMPLKGIGLSCAFEGSGFYGATVNESNLKMEVTIDVDGKVLIKAPTPPAAIFEIWTNIASTILEVEKNAVVMDDEISSKEEPLLPNIEADNISILTNLLKKCCSAIQKQRFRQPLPISVKKSVKSSGNKKWNSAKFSGEPFISTSWIATISEIEVDPCTYSQNILSIWICVYGGQILNKQRAVLSIKKAVRQVLLSSIPGSTTNNTPINIYFIDSKEEPKEIGDLVFNALPSSITNALSSALNQEVQALPLLPDALYYPFTPTEEVKNED